MRRGRAEGTDPGPAGARLVRSGLRNLPRLVRHLGGNRRFRDAHRSSRRPDCGASRACRGLGTTARSDHRRWSRRQKSAGRRATSTHRNIGLTRQRRPPWQDRQRVWRASRGRTDRFTEQHLCVVGPIANGRRTICRGRLLTRRYVAQPYAAQSGGRKGARRNTCRRRFLAPLLRTQRKRQRESNCQERIANHHASQRNLPSQRNPPRPRNFPEPTRVPRTARACASGHQTHASAKAPQS